MSETQKVQALQDLLSKVHPKARYISEIHIEDNTDSVVKQIINGDIQIPHFRGSIDNLNNKKDFQAIIRQKFLSKVQSQKKALEQKLSYISNSINSLKKYQNMKLRSSGQIENSRQWSKERDIVWKKQIQKRSKQLEQKRQKAEEKAKKKQQQNKQAVERLKKQQQDIKKQQILQNIQKIKSRVQMRQNQIKSENQRLKQVLQKRKLYQKIQQNYHIRQNSELQERKKKLAVIRSLHKPVDSTEILQHQQKFIQIKKQKQQLRQRQKRMNQSRSKSYKPPYESVYYKKIAQVEENDDQTSDRAKMEKMKQFSEHVKEMFSPTIDEQKRRYFEEMKQKQQQILRKKQQKYKQLLQKPKIKGLQYLQLIKKLPKKREQSSPTTDRANQTEKTKYPNYLNRSANIQKKKTWTTILNSGLDKQEKARKLYFQSQKMEQQLKRKQTYTRVIKQKDTGQIDQQYYEMIKAKLDLLKDSN